jgi:hypothetical protein
MPNTNEMPSNDLNSQSELSPTPKPDDYDSELSCNQINLSEQIDTDSTENNNDELNVLPEESTPTQIDAEDKTLSNLLQEQFTTLNEIKSIAEQLAKDFTLKLKYDSTKQAQIDKLYDENVKYKNDIVKKFQTTLILAVIEQIDDAIKQISFFENTEFSETTFRKLLNSYSEIAESFQNMLFEKFDISNYQCEKETPFDPKRQRALKTFKTNDSSKNKLVKNSIRHGYEFGNEIILRPEMVEVYVYETADTQQIAQ